MTGSWRDSWSWRVRLAWALLGPVLVLTVEVESALVVLTGLGYLSPRLDGWSILVACVVLVLLTAAQVSTALRQHLGAARREFAEHRRSLEELALAELGRRERDAEQQVPLKAKPDRDLERLSAPVLWPARRLRRDPSLRVVGLRDGGRIVERFGLDPSWALRHLDEDLGIPAARRLSRRARLADARWAGHATTALFASIGAVTVTVIAASASAAASAAVVAGQGNGRPVVSLVVTALLAVVAGAETFAARRAGGAVIAQEAGFYREVEALLELHRFELYRALAVPLPSDSAEERGGWLSAWRLGNGSVAFARTEEGTDGEPRGDAAGSARPGQLVPYEGFVSWATGDDSIELAFGRAPVLDDGHARLQVGGSDAASHAPFDITADSSSLNLLQVRASVQAPVDGRTVRRTFDFTRTADAGPEPDLWLEISQRGRFVQLLRVRAPRRSRT